MSGDRLQPTNHVANLLWTGLVAVVMLGALWLGSQFLSPSQGREAVDATPVTMSNEPWPTTLATFTPIPTSSPQPTVTPSPAPTPIVIKKERIAEIAVMEMTLSAAQITESAAIRLANTVNVPFTRERIAVEYIANVKIGLDYNQIDFQVQGPAVEVTLPQVQVLSIEPDWEASRIIDTDQRLIGSNVSELQKQAWAEAQARIKQRILNDAKLMEEARYYTRLLLQEHLQELGFTAISFK